MKRIKFHRTTLDNLPLPEPGKRDEYQDAAHPTLIIRIAPSGVKTFGTRRKVAGRSIRVTLGTYKRPGDTMPQMTVEQARRAAMRVQAQVLEGVNPNEVKRARSAAGMSLEQALEHYVADNRSLKTSTAASYKAVLNDTVKDWLLRPLREITDERLMKRFLRVGERSPARANQLGRILRAIWNYAKTYNPKTGPALYGDNPVSVLTTRRAWYRIERRRTRIKDHALPDWWAAVQALREESMPSAICAADLFTVLLLTGLRPGEASRLRWEHVDLRERTITIPDSKNREDYVLPLSDVLLAIFERRSASKIGDYVFPATRDGKQPFLKVTLHKYKRWLWKNSEVNFAPYDLRRGFATIAESLDLSAYAIKRLLNHRTIESDVTAGYIGRDNRRLAIAMQRITDRFMELVAHNENVVELPVERMRA